MQPLVKAWVDQFDEADRADAAILASLIRLVPGDAFRRDLTRVLEDRLRIGPNPMALYNETERKKWNGQPNRLFPETSRASKMQKGKKTVRAYGRVGPPLVPRQRQVAEEIGSEGVVANVLTQLHKRHRKSILLNPGADIIREKRARPVRSGNGLHRKRRSRHQLSQCRMEAADSSQLVVEAQSFRPLFRSGGLRRDRSWGPTRKGSRLIAHRQLGDTMPNNSNGLSPRKSQADGRAVSSLCATGVQTHGLWRSGGAFGI